MTWRVRRVWRDCGRVGDGGKREHWRGRKWKWDRQRENYSREAGRERGREGEREKGREGEREGGGGGERERERSEEHV